MNGQAFTGARPGGRAARVRDAVVDATIDEIVAAGAAVVSIEAVARRAGVNKTTIYRRWPDPHALALDVLLDWVGSQVAVPDTGTLVRDLAALATAVGELITGPLGHAVVLAFTDDALAPVRARFVAQRRRAGRAIVRRAMARGELPDGTPPGQLLETLLAPLYFRALVSGEPVTAATVRRCVRVTLAAYAADR